MQMSANDLQTTTSRKIWYGMMVVFQPVYRRLVWCPELLISVNVESVFKNSGRRTESIPRDSRKDPDESRVIT